MSRIISAFPLLDRILELRYPYSKEVGKILCKKTSKNQITLPKKISERFKGVEYFEVAVKKKQIVLTPVKFQPLYNSSLEEIRKKMFALGIEEKDVEDAVRWARKNK